MSSLGKPYLSQITEKSEESKNYSLNSGYNPEGDGSSQSISVQDLAKPMATQNSDQGKSTYHMKSTAGSTYKQALSEYSGGRFSEAITLSVKD